jgi:hypothetical protein
MSKETLVITAIDKALNPSIMSILADSGTVKKPCSWHLEH